MHTSDIITVSVAVCAAIITLMLLVGAILGGNLKEKIYRCFFTMLLFNFVGACSEFTLSLLFGTPGQTISILIHIIDFMSYFCGIITFVIFSMYLYEFFSSYGKVTKKPFVVIASIYSLNIPLMLAAEFVPIFAVLDEHNRFQLKDTLWMTNIFPFISISIAIVVTLLYIKPLMLKTKEWLSLMLYMLVPFFCLLTEIFLPNVWFVYFGSTITMLLIYINIQVDLSHRFKEQEFEMANSRIAIMLSQIQPHFLYNSLAAIENLCIENPIQARDTVRQFAKYLRGNLDSLTHNKLVPFSKELELVRNYMFIEQTRFDEKLRVEYEVETTEFELPALTVQPIMENAVRNGVNKKKKGGTVLLRTAEKDGYTIISVIDDGAGFDPQVTEQPERSHIGIANVRERLATMCGGTLQIDSVIGKGTTATITIPKRRP